MAKKKKAAPKSGKKKEKKTSQPAPKWKDYQNEVAALFTKLGCTVETDITMQGVRAKHDVDVLVRFNRFGIKQTWVIECKLWTRRIPKERILTLQQIVEDVGADRGVVIAESGFQSGARDVTTSKNTTLTSIPELQQAAAGDLLAIGLEKLVRKADELMHDAWSLYDTERSPGKSTSRPKPGVDGNGLMRTIGRLGLVERGVKEARFGRLPVAVDVGIDGNSLVFADSLEDFVADASAVLEDCERFLRAQPSANVKEP